MLATKNTAQHRRPRARSLEGAGGEPGEVEVHPALVGHEARLGDELGERREGHREGGVAGVGAVPPHALHIPRCETQATIVEHGLGASWGGVTLICIRWVVAERRSPASGQDRSMPSPPSFLASSSSARHSGAACAPLGSTGKEAASRTVSWNLGCSSMSSGPNEAYLWLQMMSGVGLTWLCHQLDCPLSVQHVYAQFQRISHVGLHEALPDPRSDVHLRRHRHQTASETA